LLTVEKERKQMTVSEAGYRNSVPGLLSNARPA